jgi:hypothetical protein
MGMLRAAGCRRLFLEGNLFIAPISWMMANIRGNAFAESVLIFVAVSCSCSVQYTTIEYEIPRQPTGPPVFLLVVDTNTDDEKLQNLKDSLSMALNLIPQVGQRHIEPFSVCHCCVSVCDGRTRQVSRFGAETSTLHACCVVPCSCDTCN